MSDDYLATTSTTGAVAVGGSVTGDVEFTGDRDWFAVTLMAGRTYRVDLEGSRTGGGTLPDPYLRGVYDANGTLIDGTANDDGGTGLNSRVTFTPDEAGTFYIAAGAFRASQGTYTVSVIDVTDGRPDDFTAAATTTGTVAVGGSATGDIEFVGDRDWFAVTLVAGRTYRVDLEGFSSGGGTLPDPYLRGIHDADGTLIDGTANDDGGTELNSRVTFTPDEAGTFYIAAGAFRSSQGTYTVSVIDVTDGPPDDFAAVATTTGTVAVGGSATGDIQFTGDRDWFAVTLEAGKTYRFELEGSSSGGGTLVYPYLRGIHDADGTLIDGTVNDDRGLFDLDSRMTFVPSADGTYYVSAGAYRGDIGTYQVSVSEVTDDYADDSSTTGTVAVGGSATGEIEFTGDRDWFAVTLVAGRTYRIDLKGSGTDGDTLRNPHLRGIHDADGTLIDGTTNDTRDWSYSDSLLTFTPSADGTYYVSAGATYRGDIGTYQLSVTEITDDYADDTTTTGTVAVGGSATGDIQFTGDRDWFAVTLEAEKTYRIDLKGSHSSAGTLGDPYLHGVHDASGTLIDGTANDDRARFMRDSQVTFTPDADGTYYVAAGAYRDNLGTYQVSVTEDGDGM